MSNLHKDNLFILESDRVYQKSALSPRFFPFPGVASEASQTQ